MTIKFHAYLPAIHFVLTNVDVHANGDVAMGEHAFHDLLQNARYKKFNVDKQGGAVTDLSGNELFYFRRPLGQVVFDGKDCIPCQYIGLKDRYGMEIHKNMEVRYSNGLIIGFRGIVVYDPLGACYAIRKKSGTMISFRKGGQIGKGDICYAIQVVGWAFDEEKKEQI